MTSEPLVSIILSYYNNEDFLSEAILSVINQSYQNWELIAVNDGSTDDSAKVAQSFTDHRIRCLEKPNGGVSSGRNIGLNRMRGIYFCFLDADDSLPSHSVGARVKVLQDNSDYHFVDGTVVKMDQNMANAFGRWRPSFFGNPFEDLVKLTGKSFFGPSWMIRRQSDVVYRFREGLTHCEDLLFYMEIARSGGRYCYTEEDILYYRVHGKSAMANIDGLSNGYHEVYHWLKNQGIGQELVNEYRHKVNRIISRSYLNAFNPIKAIKKRLV
jgi:glycosyltransferase involved in cell wall biosynthesis